MALWLSESDTSSVKGCRLGGAEIDNMGSTTPDAKNTTVSIAEVFPS